MNMNKSFLIEYSIYQCNWLQNPTNTTCLDRRNHVLKGRTNHVCVLWVQNWTCVKVVQRKTLHNSLSLVWFLLIVSSSNQHNTKANPESLRKDMKNWCQRSTQFHRWCIYLHSWYLLCKISFEVSSVTQVKCLRLLHIWGRVSCISIMLSKVQSSWNTNLKVLLVRILSVNFIVCSIHSWSIRTSWYRILLSNTWMRLRLDSSKIWFWICCLKQFVLFSFIWYQSPIWDSSSLKFCKWHLWVNLVTLKEEVDGYLEILLYHLWLWNLYSKMGSHMSLLHKISPKGVWGNMPFNISIHWKSRWLKGYFLWKLSFLVCLWVYHKNVYLH